MHIIAFNSGDSRIRHTRTINSTVCYRFYRSNEFVNIYDESVCWFAETRLMCAFVCVCIGWCIVSNNDMDAVACMLICEDANIAPTDMTKCLTKSFV